MFIDRRTDTNAEGYIVIVVLLLTAVLLMLGLSMAARTTEQVFLSSQEADSTRVFNAAESGIEEALYQLDTGAVDPDAITGLAEKVETTLPDLNNSSVAVVGTKPDEIEDLSVKQGQSVTVPAGGNNPVFTWNQIECTNAPGLLVTLYTNEGGGRAYHQTYASVLTAGDKCTTNENLNLPATRVDDTNSVSLSLADFVSSAPVAPDKPLFYRVTPLYADVTFTSVMYSGAVEIISTATDAIEGDTALTNEQRRIQVIRTEPAPPSIFDYAVFSGGDLVKL